MTSPKKKSLKEKLSSFFKTIPQTFYGPAFYASLAKRPTSKGILYLLGLHVVILIAMILTLAGFVMFGFGKIDAAIDNAANNYPEELVLTFEGGTVSSSVPSPYYIGADVFGLTLGEDDLSHLIVIDTETEYSNEAHKAHDAYVWLTKDSIYAYENENTSQVRGFSLSDVEEDGVVDKDIILTIADELKPIMKIGLVATGLFALPILLGFLFGWGLLYAFFLALLIMLLAKLLKRQYTYMQCYTIALYALTIGIAVDLIGIYLSFTVISALPTFLPTAIILLVVGLNLHASKPPSKE